MARQACSGPHENQMGTLMVLDLVYNIHYDKWKMIHHNHKSNFFTI